MSISDTNNFRVAVIQTEVSFDKKENILSKVNDYIEECVKIKANLICLPENFFGQINFNEINENHIRELSEHLPGDITKFLMKRAKENGVFIAANILVNDSEDIYNSAVLIDPNGELIGVHKKICLGYFEGNVLKSGHDAKVYETSFGKVGMLIGNDINSFDVCKQLVEKDAEIIICLTQIPDRFAAPFETIAEARSIDMDAFIVVASTVGPHKITEMYFKGVSRIIGNPLLLGRNPDREGFILAKADDREMIIYCDCNIEKLRKTRKHAFRPNR